ncbi:MAG: DUF4377 domain-containing protein [Paludibacteraceae bacterium]|nr:DUF4377 domain-containing protein [Paludibacteraceae bacterium]
MKKFLISILMTLSIAPAFAGDYMKVAEKYVITEDYQRCYNVKPGYSRKDNTPWTPYCGKINNFYYEEGYEYTIMVESYDLNQPEMTVTKTLARDNSSYYKRLQRKKDSIKAVRAAQAKTKK